MRTGGTAVALLLLAACSQAPLDEPEPALSIGAGAWVADLVEERLEPGAVMALVLPPSAAGRPSRVVLARRVAASPVQVIAALVDVERYPQCVQQVRRVRVLERGADVVRFEAELEVPLQNLTYCLRYDVTGTRVDVTGESGAVEGGRFCWEALPQPDGTLLVYTSESRLGEEAGMLIRAVLEMHPDLQEGMAFAQGLRFLNDICAAAEQGRGADG